MNQQRTILVTGASGFVGAALVERLASDDRYKVLALLRKEGLYFSSRVVPVYVKTDYLLGQLLPLENVEVLVHCAARVHIMSDLPDPLTEYRKINVEGTLKLAEQASCAGVKRFVFISSIKVNGEATRLGKPYTADDIPAPCDPYGVSKMEAEQQLRVLAERTGMEVVIIRPVLVYGPGVKANFLRMMNMIDKQVYLPLGTIHNRRSLVALDNLVDLIMVCLSHPSAANQTFLVSDDHDMSTTELLRRMGAALGKPARLFPVPAFMLKLAFVIIGRKAIAQRLVGSLQVDVGKTRRLLGWTPPSTVDSALRKTADSFQDA